MRKCYIKFGASLNLVIPLLELINFPSLNPYLAP